MRKFLLIALCVWVSVTFANAQTYSRVKQHVREYDRVAGQVEKLLPYLPTNYVAYSSDVVAVVSNVAAHVASTEDPHAAAGYLRVESPAEQAYIKWDGSDWVSEYGVRASMLASEAVAAHGAGTLGTLYPGQLLYADHTTDGNRHVYVCTNAFSPADFATNDMSWLPAAVSPDPRWTVFVRQGPQGRVGPPGNSTDGLDGIGNVLYGRWDPYKEYLYSTATPIVVSYGGRWYDCVASSTGYPPSQIGATNYWAISVDKGTSGTVVGWTNLLFRGDWSSGVADYEENDAVWWLGNLFVVSATNQAPGAGDAPSLDGDWVGVDNAWWHPLVLRGERGLQGVKGDYLNSYTVYTLVPGTNTMFEVAPGPSETRYLPRFVSQSGANLTMRWAGFSDLLPISSFSPSNVVATGTWDFADATVSNLYLPPDAIQTASIAALADGVATIDLGSNWCWRLDASGDITAINFSTAGLKEGAMNANSVKGILLEVSRGSTANWVWGGHLSHITNTAPPADAVSHLLLIGPSQDVTGTNGWAVY